MNKKDLSERDICTKYITPAVVNAGWDIQWQILEEVGFTKGRIIVRGKLVTRGKAQRADYILYYKPNIPIALIEAKDNNNPIGGGMQQAIITRLRSISHLFSRRTETDSYFTIGQGRAANSKPSWGSTGFQRRLSFGNRIESGRTWRRRKKKSFCRTTTKMPGGVKYGVS